MMTAIDIAEAIDAASNRAAHRASRKQVASLFSSADAYAILRDTEWALRVRAEGSGWAVLTALRDDILDDPV